MKKIIAFSGSNSSKSINQQLVKLVADMVNEIEVEILDIRDYPAPIYGIDEEEENGIPETMQELSDKIGKADGLILASPEHNGSMPTVLKNSIDWMSRTGKKYLEDKQVLLLSASPGPRGGLTNLTHLASIMPWWGANIVDTYSVGSYYDKVVDGKLVEEVIVELRQKVSKLTAALR